MSTPQFDWPLANDAEALLRRYLAAFLTQNAFARQLADRMRDETGTDFFEWVDHLVLSPSDKTALLEAGFVLDESAETPDGEAVYGNPRPSSLSARNSSPTSSLLTIFPPKSKANHSLATAASSFPNKMALVSKPPNVMLIAALSPLH
jgi:hypothetical protein